MVARGHLKRSDYRLGLIELLEERSVLRRQLDGLGVDRLIELRQLRRADDWRANARLRQHPRQCDLHAADASARGEVPDTIRNREVRVLVVELRRELVAVGAGRRTAAALLPIAGKKTARHRAVRNDADPFSAAERHHLA